MKTALFVSFSLVGCIEELGSVESMIRNPHTKVSLPEKIGTTNYVLN